MALTKDYTAILASTSNAAGGTTNSSTFDLVYGTSVIVQMTNGATGPTVPCDAILQVTPDNGTTWIERPPRITASVVASADHIGVFELGIGTGGDWAKARIQFTSNTGQAVTCQARRSSTSALV